jgi:hypothetical protein
MTHKHPNPVELNDQDSSQAEELSDLKPMRTAPQILLKVVEDKDGNPIGVTEATDGFEDEASLLRWKNFVTKKLTQMREHEDFFIKVLECHESGENDTALNLLRKRSDLPEFLLFILDYMNDPASRAKAGGDAKSAGLISYKELAQREYCEKKNIQGNLKQMAFAIDFVERMNIDYAKTQDELSELEMKANALKKVLNAMDHENRKNSSESKDLRSVKERIRVMKRHPKPVTEDTVVTWLTKTQLQRFIPSAEQTSRP